MSLQLGFHRYTITPPNGIDMTGYGGREGPAVGVLDDLVLDAIAFREGDEGLVWLNADLLSFATDQVQRIRQQIEAALGVPAERVALCTTHTHAGPAVPRLRDLGDPDPDYIGLLERWAVSAASIAWQNASPVNLSFGKGECSTIVRNRRRPPGPVDPEVLVLSWSGSRQGANVCFTCHPVVLTNNNRLFSADYCGVTRAPMERALGGGFPVSFTNGCAGDINPLQQGMENMSPYGRQLAFAALSAMERKQDLAGLPLRAASAVVELPWVDPPSLEECRWEVGYFEKELAAPDSQHDKFTAKAFLGWARDRLQQVESGTYPDSQPAEVQVFRIGDLAVVFLPGEPLVRLGLRIKDASPAPVTWVAGHVNATVGYVADEESYEHGGYEVVHAARYYMMGPYKAEAGQKL
ncbi:MAG: hypothetical protein HY318_09045, partial [Armatimonadetes bacterium]|nr:hypothetical protein [Armatimonadota bacterium]